MNTTAVSVLTDRSVFLACLWSVALLLSACNEPASGPDTPRALEGRVETQGIRNTDAVGYGGSGVADRVDAALDAQDQRKAQLYAALDAQQ